ncbi:MAG TPA: flagellar hook-associated protein 3 [Caldilineae bacterium]|nr:flagellar hook-associated protein 3 [Caldilineae bacterium]
MRVTQKRLIEEASWNIADHLERLQRLQSVLASGKRIQKPKDDPLGIERALEIRSYLRGLETSLRNIRLTTDWLGATEKALQDLNDVLKRAQTIALNAASEASQSPEAFQGWIAEVEALLKQAVQIGNSNHRGLYLFAGRKVKTAPFELTSASSWQVTYHGDDGKLEHELEKDVRIQVNISGEYPLFQQVFNSLIDLRSRLESGDTAGIRDSVGDLEQAMDSVLEALSVVGSRTNRVNATEKRLKKWELELRRLLSDLEDADIAETALNMSLEDQVYRALLAASARLVGPALIDYLY